MELRSLTDRLQRAEPWLDLGNVYRGEQQSSRLSKLWFLQEKSKCLCPNGPGAETTLESEREEVAEQKEKNGHEVPQQNQSRAELEEQPLQTGKERPAGDERETKHRKGKGSDLNPVSGEGRSPTERLMDSNVGKDVSDMSSSSDLIKKTLGLP